MNRPPPSWIHRLRRLRGGLPALVGLAWLVSHAAADSVRFLPAGPDSFATRAELIRSAKGSIDVAMFIWRQDQAGLGTAALLRDAARRGVRVRVIIDAMANELPPSVFAALEQPTPAFEARVFHMPSLHDPSRLNRRLHDKILVVDGRHLMVGGRNLADDYFDPGRKKHYLDLDVVAESRTAAAAATRYFDALWASSQLDNPEWRLPSTPARQRRLGMPAARGPNRGVRQGTRMIDAAEAQLPAPPPAAERRRTIPVPPAALRFVHDRVPKAPGGSTCWAGTAQLLEQAGREAWLVTPWLVTTPDSAALLQRCLARGVRLHVVTNSLNACRDYLVFAAHSQSCRQLAQQGCEVHLMPGPASIHSKAFVIDQKVAAVGSQNFDPRSELWNTESMLIIEDPAAARDLLDAIRAQSADSYLLDPRAPDMTGTDHPSPAVRWKQAWLPLLHLVDPVLRPAL